MKRGDIFRSESGYRVCNGTWGDNPIIDQAKWFSTKKAAEKHSKKLVEKEKMENELLKKEYGFE